MIKGLHKQGLYNFYRLTLRHHPCLCNQDFICLSLTNMRLWSRDAAEHIHGQQTQRNDVSRRKKLTASSQFFEISFMALLFMLKQPSTHTLVPSARRIKQKNGHPPFFATRSPSTIIVIRRYLSKAIIKINKMVMPYVKEMTALGDPEATASGSLPLNPYFSPLHTTTTNSNDVTRIKEKRFKKQTVNKCEGGWLFFPSLAHIGGALNSSHDNKPGIETLHTCAICE